MRPCPSSCHHDLKRRGTIEDPLKLQVSLGWQYQQKRGPTLPHELRQVRLSRWCQFDDLLEAFTEGKGMIHIILLMAILRTWQRNFSGFEESRKYNFSAGKGHVRPPWIIRAEACSGWLGIWAGGPLCQAGWEGSQLGPLQLTIAGVRVGSLVCEAQCRLLPSWLPPRGTCPVLEHGHVVFE